MLCFVCPTELVTFSFQGRFENGTNAENFEQMKTAAETNEGTRMTIGARIKCAKSVQYANIAKY